ncbi:TATA box-binding protein-associated factor RNA polymerase [Salix suchowensis]|nr:TATA box-binding protein-associated factor RNA polymerase [Salix suchowensis]
MAMIEFSQEWKSGFPIDTVFKAPLLLSKGTSESFIGPLIFNPIPESLAHLFTSPALSPPLLNPPPHLSLTRFISTSTLADAPLPLSTASSIAFSFGPQDLHFSSPLLAYNRLQFLKCPHDDTVVVFLTTGTNLDRVGFLLLSVKDKSLVATGDQKGGIFTANKSLGSKIVRVLVNPIEEDDSFLNGNYSFSGSFGYLLVYTMYSVNWFCVKYSESMKRPVLSYLGCKNFKSCGIASACWSPYIKVQSVVLLENGTLFLFDLEADCSDKYFRGTKLKVSWGDEGKLGDCKWFGCEFSWHCRVLIVARSDAVFMVDWKCGDFDVICLARIGMFSAYALSENERFLAMSRAVSDSLHFALVSETMLIICDVRKPMVPLLQWAHGLDKPCFIDVLRLSDLRSNSRDDTHDWANSSGSVILLGSFWNCEFSLFFYGPSFPPRKGSIALEISNFSSCLYAWDHPSRLMLSGDDCQCGDCLVREQFWKEALPEWTDWQQKKDMVLGFGVLSNDLSSLLFEPDEFGGFALIRLMSSGKLESQRYCASWELAKNIEVAQRDPMPHSEDNLLYFMGDEEYKFPRKFKYFELNYLHAYLNGNLSQVLDSNMAKPCEYPHEKESFSLEFHEVLCEKLKICGFGRFRTSPAITVTFNDINLPTSIHEVALRRMWAELPTEFLQLAFSSYSDLHEVLLDQKRVTLEFSVVPELPQLPPFFLRKPSNRSNRWSRKVQSGDALVGPVLPLPILSTLHELLNGCPNSQEETGGFSSESELRVQCNEVMQVAKEVAVSDSTTKLQDDNAVSLDDDGDDFLGHSEKPKSFLLYHPAACHLSFEVHKEDNSVYQDDKFASMITKVHDKQSPHPEKVEAFKLEYFDDLCPITLKFDDREVKFSSQESKISNLLKKNFSKWQEEFTPYREFCSRFTSPRDKMA